MEPRPSRDVVRKRNTERREACDLIALVSARMFSTPPEHSSWRLHIPWQEIRGEDEGLEKSWVCKVLTVPLTAAQSPLGASMVDPRVNALCLSERQLSAVQASLPHAEAHETSLTFSLDLCRKYFFKKQTCNRS